MWGISVSVIDLTITAKQLEFTQRSNDQDLPDYIQYMCVMYEAPI